MKWVFLAILTASIWPASVWLRKNPDKLGRFCFLIGFLPFVTNWFHLLSAPISWGWIGYTKGFEIYVIDVVAVVIMIALRGGLVRMGFVVPMALYFIATLIATLGAQMPEAASFYCWQLTRVFVVYLAVANACTSNLRATTSIIMGFAVGEILECAISVWQRFALHILQTIGTMDSQNELGLASHFVIFPFFALMLGGRRGWLPPIVVVAGLVTDALTTSRGTVVLGLAGLGIVWLLSSLARFSGRKFGVAISGVVALALVAPLAAASFDQRFRQGGIEFAEDHERLAYKRAASMMIADHPEGVGPNNFAFVANIGGYYSFSGPGISNLGRSSNVHNLYILILAETGPAGLASYILMLAAPFVAGIRYGLRSGRREANNPQADLLIGASVTLLIVSIHSTEEWVMIAPILEYFLAILFGVIAGLTTTEKLSSAAQRLGIGT